MFIYFLIEIDFLNIRSGQSYLLLANENAHLATYEHIKIFVLVSQNQIEICSKFCSKIPKVREKLEEMFKIYDSVRKNLQDEARFI